MPISPLKTGVCPDCGGSLQPIKIFDRGPQSMAGIAIDSETVLYTSADAERGSWSGRFPEIGEVKSQICTSCQRIFLYGAPLQGK
jgi:hypothetical protein